jgi:hypothetical protein
LDPIGSQDLFGNASGQAAPLDGDELLMVGIGGYNELPHPGGIQGFESVSDRAGLVGPERVRFDLFQGLQVFPLRRPAQRDQQREVTERLPTGYVNPAPVRRRFDQPAPKRKGVFHGHLFAPLGAATKVA